MKCVCVLRGVEGRPIYTSGGWFPANAHMEGDQVPWPWLLLEMHLDGRQGRFGRTWGSADPPSAPRPYPPLASWQVGPCVFPYVHYAWRAHLLCQVGPLCKWVTPDAIFCVVVWRLRRVFFLFHSCSSEMYKTRKQLWSKVSDTNMWVRHIVSFIMSLVDGRIWHLRTVNICKPWNPFRA